MFLAHLSQLTQYTCDHCTYEATTKDNLGMHISNDHESELYICDECGLRFPLATTMYSHMQKDHERDGLIEDEFICEECGIKFSEATRLSDHLKNHVIEFQCESVTFKRHLLVLY